MRRHDPRALSAPVRRRCRLGSKGQRPGRPHPRAHRLPGLEHLGIEIVSTSGTARALQEAGHKVAASYAGTATYHDSCSGLRELGVKAQPRKLLATVAGLTLRESAAAETCCGFGGTFCVKYPDISGRMVDVKADDLLATGADLVLAGDMGCLLNIAGRLKRKGAAMQARHVAEVLAGALDTPAIGEPDGTA